MSCDYISEYFIHKDKNTLFKILFTAYLTGKYYRILALDILAIIYSGLIVLVDRYWGEKDTVKK